MGRFDVLSDYDFEELAADLLRAETGLRFRAGTRGRDGGIDLLAIDDTARHVAQCKHYRTGDFGRVVQKARHEAERLRSGQLECGSYRFVTSMRLPQKHYEDIVAILGPWIDNAGHVLGESDLEHLLRVHPKVEGRHVKLWISGAGALHRALNAGAYTSSQALLHDIAAALPRYVQTDVFFQARSVLDRHQVCVIAGPPGVGKTTLAHLLAVDAVERGYELFDIPQGGLAEAWGLLDPDARQIFLYDDFLGRIALSPEHEDDHALIRFMRQVARSPNSRMVLTTREYILRQAQHLSEVLDDDGSGLHPFLVHLDSYDRFERALIFYNHVYFSKKVDAPKRRALIQRYAKIIDHPNYNPRLVEWMTSMADDDVGANADRDYVEYCVDVLDHPRRLWRKAFMDGLDDPDRVLLLTLASLSEPVIMPTLEAAFLHACQTRGIPTHDHRLQRSLSTLEGSFVTIRQLEDGTVVAPRNPSLLDFLRDYLLASNPDAERMLEGVLLFQQAGWVWGATSPGGDDDDDIFDTSEPPADALLPAFARAFETTFDSPLADGGPARPIARIARLVDFMQKAPALVPLVRPWLAPAVRARVGTSLQANPFIIEVLVLLARLGRCGVVEAAPFVEPLLPRLLDDPAPNEYDRWEAIEVVFEFAPQLFEPALLQQVHAQYLTDFRRVIRPLVDDIATIDDDDDLGYDADAMLATIDTFASIGHTLQIADSDMSEFEDFMEDFTMWSVTRDVRQEILMQEQTDAEEEEEDDDDAEGRSDDDHAAIADIRAAEDGPAAVDALFRALAEDE